MKAIFTLSLAFWAGLLSGQGLITGAEYFIDSDPGYGEATAVGITPGASVTASLNVPLTSLEPGLHVIAIRTENDEGRRSPAARKNFFVFAFSSPSPMVDAEYFFDEDPGSGNGSAIDVDQGMSVSATVAVPVPELESGLHTLSIRTKNAAGRRSVYARKNFYLFKYAPNLHITAAEYFFNEDPGAGNGTALLITPGTSVTIETAVELPADLPKGINTLQIRVRDSAGQWSLYARRMIFNTDLGEVLDLVQAEYFIDEDPGEGEAVPISVTPAPGFDLVLDIPLSGDLPEGDHMLHIRVLREDGKWSLYAAQPFEIDISAGTQDPALSVLLYPNPTADLLYIDARGRAVSSFVVYDMQGKTVLGGQVNGGALSLSSLGKGTYLVQLRFDDGFAMSKRIVVM